MKSKLRSKSNLFAAAACLALCSPVAHAGTVATTFSFQQGDLRQDGVLYGAGASYAGVLDGRVTDNSATSARTTAATATLGNQFQSGTHNGQQHCGLFSYDLTELNSFIAANTSASSFVTVSSVSFKLISSSVGSGGAMSLNLYGTDPFTSSGCSWSNYTTATPWTLPYQSGRTETAYNFTGGPSALTSSLGGTSPSTGTNTTPVGTTLTWTSSANFVSTLTTALARPDQTLYLTARGSFFNTGDNRVNVNTSPATTVDNRPELLVTLNITTVSPAESWTGTSSNSWIVAGNWNPSAVPGVGAPITFDSSSTANLATVLDQDFDILGLTVTSPSGPVSIGGANTLTVQGDGINLSAATQNLTISAPLAVGSAQSWNVASGRTLGISGAVSGSPDVTVTGAGKVSLGASNILPSGASAGNIAVNGTLDLNGFSQSVNALTGSGFVDNTGGGAITLTVGNNNAASTFSGILQDTGGTLAVIKTGTGALTLTGANDFSGGFTNNGTGNVASNNSLAFGTGPVVFSAGTIYPTAIVTFANALTLSNSTLRIGGGTGKLLTWNGPVTVTGTSALSCDGGTSGITLGSTVDITGASLSSAANGATNNFDGVISGAGGNLSVGLGTHQFSAANTYTGTTTISSTGALRLQPTGTISSSSNVVINDTGNFNIRNTVGWVYTGTITGAGTGSININSGTDATLAGSISGVTAVNVGSTGTNATITGGISGATSVTVQTAGCTLHLGGNNGYSGNTTVTAGTLTVTVDNCLPDGSNVVIGSGILDLPASVNDAAGTLDVTDAASTINLDTGATMAFADSSGVDWTGGTLNITGTFVSGSSVRFGATDTGLTDAQLLQITAAGFTGFDLSSSGYLIATSTGGFSAWQSANSTAGDLGDDHDLDGVTNGIEYFLFGNTNSTGFTTLPGVVNTGGVLSVTWTQAATGYTGTYGTDFVVETSSTLVGAWAPATLGVGAGNVEITGNAVKYTFPAGTKTFARLKVTGP